MKHKKKIYNDLFKYDLSYSAEDWINEKLGLTLGSLIEYHYTDLLVLG
jgi:hypothetical protein